MSRKWSKRSLDNLKGIHPDLRRVMDRALQESPLDFTVIEGLRTEARQRELVAKGASKTMNSRHITGHAVDLMPTGPDGKGSFDWSLYHRLAPSVKAAAKAEGVALVWGGDWKTFPDGPHFELDRKVYPAGKSAETPKSKPDARLREAIAELDAGHVQQTPPVLHKKPISEPPIKRGNWLTALIAALAALFKKRK